MIVTGHIPNDNTRTLENWLKDSFKLSIPLFLRIFT